MITFITSNQKKLKEVREILGDDIELQSKSIDLPEIQSVSVEEVVKLKVQYAYNIIKQPVIVEDTGLYIKNMNEFPGALIKMYYDSIGNDGIARFNGKSRAYAKTIIGYYDGIVIKYFAGKLKGHISAQPTGSGFGWDPVFIPKGYNKTLAEMTSEEKNAISMRGIAFKGLRNHLLNH
jgi:XTP/dITP diphosphohydrolase